VPALDDNKNSREIDRFGVEGLPSRKVPFGMSQSLSSDVIRPNLFLVGAAKSGTTSLYASLKGHPDIFMSDPKEPGFFIPPALRAAPLFRAGASEQESLGVYLDLFRAGGNRRYLGEASNDYTMHPHRGASAEAIHAFAPTARIIYIVRDPVKRTISDYWWHFKLEIENRSPDEAITENSKYCDVSHYAMQLRPYLERFSPEQVWVLTLEDFSRNPALELARIFRWLELDPTKAPPAKETRENITPTTFERNRCPQCLAEFLQSRPYRLLRPMIPPPLRQSVRNLMVTRIDCSRVDLTGVKAYLRPRQQRETEELSDLLGRSFPDWTTLYEACRARTSSRLAAVA
jgi:Sulfotransferase family